MNRSIAGSTPFSVEQRAWLHGFFSGLIGIQPTIAPTDVPAAPSTSLQSDRLARQELQDEFPWHDPELPIDHRLALADGKPLKRKLMAAMAQLDCGSCGYLCETYSEAIAAGAEGSLNLCSPGGKETKQMIKKLLKESGTSLPRIPATSTADNGVTKQGDRWSRQNPYQARMVKAVALNKKGSAKSTHHVVIDLGGSGIQYQPGDALGVFPTNCPELAAAILRQLDADPFTRVETRAGTKRSLVDALVNDCCLKDPSDELVELLASRSTSPVAKRTLLQMSDNGAAEGVDVLDVLEIAQGAVVSANEFVARLDPLNVRLYSIASSMKQVGDEVHLTVGEVMYDRQGRKRAGVASTMLCQRLGEGDRLRVFIQPNQSGFTLPDDPDAAMIMIGPGTGIAPFRAFLQERKAALCSGKNWLFFGDQHEAYDFLYERELAQHLASGTLTRLDTAFSRDGNAKVYVQDRMRENAAELWQWILDGTYLFVCGDASRMASDVDRTLTSIVAQQGNMTSEAAAAYVADLRKQKRYVRDIY